ncbi:hypothetical protein C0Q70_12786 [Pomacea canaliculata]|uniref:Uncharacterized protein n=1 Tax=Pomacea canaliculata TaxID=400727 RepID=A0A2T7P2I6_POMCA|nr:hypothetical protein C0Q70_12786 [Pomacea canaliculata]
MVSLVVLIQNCSLLTDSSSDVLPMAIYLASALRMVSYLCTAFLTQHERRRQVITSGLHFVYLGWRRDLEENDLFDLNPRDSSDVLVPPFEREWELEKDRFRNKQLSKEKSNDSTKADSTVTTSLPLLTTDPRKRDIHFPAPVLETTSLMGTVVISCSTHRAPREWGCHCLWYPRPPRGQRGGPEDALAVPSFVEARGTLADPRLVSETHETNKVHFHWLTFSRNGSNTLTLTVDTCCSLLIEQVGTPDPSDDRVWPGYVLAVLMFLVQMVKSLLFNFSFWSSQVAGMQLKTILIAAIYRKSLTMNSAARRLATGGEIVNLMSVDCQRIQDVMNFFFYAWTTPLQVIMVVGVLYVYIGPSVFAGVIMLLLLVPLNSYIASRQQKLNISNLKFKDQRLRLTTEVLSGIKVLKLYAWEPSFEKMITDLRNEETRILLRISYLNVLMGVCWNFAPYLVTLATFTVFVEVSPDNHLDARRAFVTLALFNMLRVPLGLLSTIISMTVQSIVSVQRINKFLCCEDLDTSSVTYDANAANAISVRNGTFTWDRSYEPVLKNIDIEIGVGSLVAVVGHVGSGKSSLISSFLGETEKVSGDVTIKSSVAYVPQQAWIQNATLRDNVLFGKLFNEKRYQQVLRACALERDLEILSAGDMTEIGERGINLSGGQKQRVSLARAVYSDSDIYLLDDPLSAVDSHVGKHILQQGHRPNGLLRNKTRVLVTHGIHWLPMVDEIIVLSDNGISEKGSYDTLMSHNGPFARFLKLHLQQKEDSEEEEDPEISTLINKIREDVETATSDGATSGDDLTRLAKARRRKYSRTRSRSKSLTESTKSKSGKRHLEEDKLEEDKGRLVHEETMEKGKVKWSVFFTYLRAAGAVPFTASILFFLLFQAANAAGNFWLSRWTDDPFLAAANDNATLRHDYNIKNDYYLMVFGMLGIAQMIALIFNNLLFWVRMVVASKILHRRLLASVLRSPMAYFDTTPIGRMVNRFSRDIETIDNNLPIIIRDFLSTGTMALVTVIVISISTPLFITLVVPILILYYFIQSFYIPTSRQLKRIESVTRSPIYVHFSETISGGATIRAYRAVDRFIEESKRRVDRNQSFYFASLGANRLFMSIFPGNDLSRFYSLEDFGLPDLDGPTDERPGDKHRVGGESEGILRAGVRGQSRGKEVEISEVGIVGRTGAGKSSLTLSLFRLIEAAGGCIMIDGVNIADIGLHDLRSRITILPQDPVLFSGTLRMNLDPLDQYSDDQIWMALERAHLKHFAEELPEKLNHQVGEEGQSLSVGQRQLVCLARTLLRRTKLLVLDEATAAVDMETDTLIQNTIREAFSTCTIIAIAHRLNTIMDYDRILVLDGGLVKEYDCPHVLLADKKSIFYSLAKDADLV